MVNLELFLNGDQKARSDKLPRVGFTVKSLVNEANVDGRINLTPKAYQRNFHADKSWQEQFLVSLFTDGIVIPEIALRVGENIPEGWASEVMDGCQRVSTILAFVKGEVNLPIDEPLLEGRLFEGSDRTQDLQGVSFKALSDSAREHFYNQEIGAMCYYDIDSLFAGFLFTEVLNNTNTLNPQEKRQAIASAMSTQIQNWTRFDKILPIFETKKNGDLKYIASANHSRLDVDKTLAELCYMLHNKDFEKKGTTGKTITDFYKFQAKQYPTSYGNASFVARVLTQVNQAFRGNTTAKTLGLKAFRNFSYLVGELLDIGIKVDPVEFMRVYQKALDNLKAVKPAEGLSESPYSLRMRGNGGDDTKTALSMIREEMNSIGFHQVNLDKRRTFTEEQIAKAYRDQNGICAICGEKMPPFDTANIHGDHILQYKDGGLTTQDNCAAVHSTCNWRK